MSVVEPVIFASGVIAGLCVRVPVDAWLRARRRLRAERETLRNWREFQRSASKRARGGRS